MAERPLLRRCAIYVRKSSEEGLDMAYNSLDAQRDACAAYIASQRHEGWSKIDKLYEDGGYSGGNLERPGLKALLEDVGKGLVDIILVYKIDRLTRSLTDFARLTELLDKHHVSFVAVTQQFNTSTSMGRLTLNVLLSFAQFEREVAGERIRDKVAASKRKGMWMGGPIPLGYAVKDRKLWIVPEEAEIVQHMFARYLELRSVHLLQRELEKQGVRSRKRPLKDGGSRGGVILGRGAISHMLKNPLYLGLIRHGGENHQGQHEAIIDEAMFHKVQRALSEQGPGDDARNKLATPSLLRGLVFDQNGNRLQPTHSNKNGVRYHYYTSAKRLRDANNDPQGVRVPAGDLERIVASAIADRLMDSSQMQQWLATEVVVDQLPHALNNAGEIGRTIADNLHGSRAIAQSLIQTITVSKTAITVRLSGCAVLQKLGINRLSGDRDDADLPQRSADDVVRGRNQATPLPPCKPFEFVITSHLLRCGKQVKLVLGHDNQATREPNPQLVAIVVQARGWFEGLSTGRYASLRDIGTEANVDKSHVSRLLSLAFLAPDITERIISGDHSPTLTPERLRKSCPLPHRWVEQRAMLLA